MKSNFVLKILVGLMLCAIFSIRVNAQNTFSKKENVLNLGIGIGSVLGGTGYTSTTPPLSVSYERGVIDHLFDDKSTLGIGAYLGYSTSKYALSDGYGWKYSYTIFGLRGTIHYQLLNRLDTYGGLMLGYNNVGSSVYGNGTSLGSASGSALIWSLYIGSRFYFTDNIGIFAELGYGIAYLQLGVSLKF